MIFEYVLLFFYCFLLFFSRACSYRLFFPLNTHLGYLRDPILRITHKERESSEIKLCIFAFFCPSVKISGSLFMSSLSISSLPAGPYSRLPTTVSCSGFFSSQMVRPTLFFSYFHMVQKTVIAFMIENYVIKKLNPQGFTSGF